MTGCKFTTSKHSPVTSPLQPLPLRRGESWFRENEEEGIGRALDEKNVRRVTFSEKIETIRERRKPSRVRETKHDDVKIDIRDVVEERKITSSVAPLYKIEKIDTRPTQEIIKNSRRKVREILSRETKDEKRLEKNPSRETPREERRSSTSPSSSVTREDALLKRDSSIISDRSLPPSSSFISCPSPFLVSASSPVKFKDDPDDPILKESTNRFVIFPIKYKEIWNLYKKQEASFWTAEEINFVDDFKDWKVLSDNEKKYIKHVLAFFAASDGIVLENLAQRFYCDVQIPEARQFYAMQMAIEAVHAETYALLVTTYFTSLKEQEEIFDSINSNDSIRRKALWALKWIGPLRGSDAKALESQRKYRELWSVKVPTDSEKGDTQKREEKTTTDTCFRKDEITEDAFHIPFDDDSGLPTRRDKDQELSSISTEKEKSVFPKETEERILARGRRVSFSSTEESISSPSSPSSFPKKVEEESISSSTSSSPSPPEKDAEYLHTKLVDLINEMRGKPKIWNTQFCQRLVEFVASEGLKKENDEEWNSSFAQRLVAFAIVEGIFFSSSFCAIYFFRKRGLMPGLTFSNELIARDEGLHCEFACLLYSTYLKRKLPQEIVHAMIREAVAEEENFVRNALPVELIGMNSDLMCQYVRFVADRLSAALGYEKIWNATNPFEWMDMISIQGKTNFFEKRVGDYQKHGVMDSLNKGKDEDKGEKDSFVMDGDF